MIFPSFVAVQRYARIDLGIRISMPWQPIAECARAWMGAGAPGWKKPEGGPTKGPHVAIGKIDYGGGEIGYLVYVKPALSGEENDYIHDYARRTATIRTSRPATSSSARSSSRSIGRWVSTPCSVSSRARTMSPSIPTRRFRPCGSAAPPRLFAAPRSPRLRQPRARRRPRIRCRAMDSRSSAARTTRCSLSATFWASDRGFPPASRTPT